MGTAAAKCSAALLLSALVAACVGCAQTVSAPLPADAASTEKAIASTPGATPTPALTPTPTPSPSPPSAQCLTEIDPNLIAPKPRPYPTLIPPPPAVPPSLENLINYADVIVRGSVLDATVRTERVPPSEWDAELSGTTVGRLMPGCAATLQARFAVTEYLKGSGPDQILVEDRLYNRYDVSGGSLQYMTDGEARSAAWARWNPSDAKGKNGSKKADPAPRRNPPESDPRRKDSVLFLRELSQDGAAGTSLVNDEGSWYSAGPRHWVPVVANAGSYGGPGDGGAPQRYAESGPQAEGDAPTVMTLPELRSRIAAFDALLKKGEGVTAYRECIERTIGAEEEKRRDFARYGPDYDPAPYVAGARMTSGLPAGAGIKKTSWRHRSYYDEVWLDGPDHRRFEVEILDGDESARNGYYIALTAARPLPAGTYHFSEHTRIYEETLCDFTVNGYALSPFTTEWIVEVVPSVEGTLHEAFFDPADSDGFIGASAKVGDLSTAAFSLDGERYVVEALRWEEGRVWLETSFPAEMSEYDIDVILPDASALLTLSSSDATVEGVGALSWPAQEPPWRAGDELMLRVRRPGPVPPAPAPRPWVPPVLNLTAEGGASDRSNYQDTGMATLRWDAPETPPPADGPKYSSGTAQRADGETYSTTPSRIPSP